MLVHHSKPLKWFIWLFLTGSIDPLWYVYPSIPSPECFPTSLSLFLVSLYRYLGCPLYPPCTPPPSHGSLIDTHLFPSCNFIWFHLFTSNHFPISRFWTNFTHFHNQNIISMLEWCPLLFFGMNTTMWTCRASSSSPPLSRFKNKRRVGHLTLQWWWSVRAS